MNQPLFPGLALHQPPSRPLSVPEALALAREHLQGSRRADAEALCVMVLQTEPENPDALHMMGLLAHLAGRQGIALALMEKAARLQPGVAQFHYNMGVVLGLLRRPADALVCYRAAVALDPLYPHAMGNLGNAALECDQLDEALAAYDAVLAQHPHEPNLTLARAIALLAMRRLDLAGPAFEAALSLAPASPRHLWEQSHHLLTAGDLARGFDLYEARFAEGIGSNVWAYPYPFPRWQGEPLAGKTLLLHGEQGLGDEIMFASIYPELIAEAGQVIICCQPHLAALFRDSFPGAHVQAQMRADADGWTRRPADWLAGAPRIDYQIPFASLGRLRRRTLADFPGQAGNPSDGPHGASHHNPSDNPRGYLRPDPAKVAHWREQLSTLPGHSGLPGLRIGLCWSANPAMQDASAARRSRKKSLAPQQLEALFDVPGVAFVSLQTREAAAQLEAAPPRVRARLFDASAGLNDFSDTAALIANLDLVISVDTSVAHLAGALGRPVWIALPWQPDWRWHEGADTSEWYPSARLFRQAALGDWDGVLGRLREALSQRAAPHAAQVLARSPAAGGVPA